MVHFLPIQYGNFSFELKSEIRSHFVTSNLVNDFLFYLQISNEHNVFHSNIPYNIINEVKLFRINVKKIFRINVNHSNKKQKVKKNHFSCNYDSVFVRIIFCFVFLYFYLKLPIQSETFILIYRDQQIEAIVLEYLQIVEFMTYSYFCQFYDIKILLLTCANSKTAIHVLY